ncbi:MAG TPA: hypothetical protein VEL11_15515 [Candidatus Bathyarchaeia archaeon]|nr:hypothetical protein [Candidatus Bathyarchaeia archaeon]
MIVISRLVAGIVLLIFGVVALGSAYDIKSDAQAQFSNLQCNNMLDAIEGDLYSPEAQACAILQSTTTCVVIGELVGGMMMMPGIILVALSFVRSHGMKSQIVQPT